MFAVQSGSDVSYIAIGESKGKGADIIRRRCGIFIFHFALKRDRPVPSLRCSGFILAYIILSFFPPQVIKKSSMKKQAKRSTVKVIRGLAV